MDGRGCAPGGDHRRRDAVELKIYFLWTQAPFPRSVRL